MFPTFPFQKDPNNATAAQLDGVDVADAKLLQDPSVITPAVPVPESDDTDPCLKFPHLGIPTFNFRLPIIQLPDPHCCPMAEGPIIDTGAIAGGIGNFLAGFANKTQFKTDHTDPKVKTLVPSPARTLIAAPAEPPHVSVEIAKTIPSIAEDILGQIVQNVMLAAASTATHVGGILTMLTAKAEALGDQAAKAMGNGLTNVLANIASMPSALSGEAASIWGSLNQAVGMLPIRQIPVGPWHPLTAKRPQLEWYNDGGLRSKWPNNGKGPDPLGALNNGLNLVKDAFNASGVMCLVSAACNLFGGVCDALARGLGLDAWGMQLEGMLRLFSVQPFHIDGLDALMHDWRNWCKLKLTFDGNTSPQHTSAQTIRQHINRATNCAAAGALPGNLMHAATGDEGDFVALGSLAQIAPAIALGLDSPHVEAIHRYVSDADPSLDGLTPNLPDMFKAGDPRLKALIDGLGAFQQVVILITNLLQAEVTDLQLHATQVGGGFTSFVQAVRSQAPELGVLTRLESNYTHNRLTGEQMDLVKSLAAMWQDLVVDENVIDDVNRKDIVHRVLAARDALGDQKLADLLDNASDVLDNFGGHIGPEVASAASVHAGLTRCLLVANSSDTEANKYARTKQILADTKVNAAELTHGGALKDYVNTVADAAQADVGFDGLARIGLPTMAASAQQSVDQIHRTTSAVATMMTQHGGRNLPDIGESGDAIDNKAENADTINYTSAAQKQAALAAKSVLTGSIPHVAATAQGFTQALIAKGDSTSAMSDHMQRIVQESANALATASLSKVTGTKLHQSYEGQVHQAKFMLHQAGHMLTQDAPFVRSTARILVSQGSIHLTEADAHQTRARWSYHVTEQATGFATVDYHVAASGTAHTVGGEIKLHGQKGTELADQVKITQAVGGPTAQAVHVELGADGKYHVWAQQEIVMHVGACQMIIGPSRIDLNPVPTLPPVIPPTPVLYTEPPAMTTTADKAVALLPAKPGRNPVPCAAPYDDPGLVGLIQDI